MAFNPWRPLLILAAGAWAYHNSLQGPFILDDTRLIVENPRLHALWPLGPLISGTSRPLVNLTLALNYQWSRLDVGSYHAVNLAIHLLAAVVLYGLLWRLLRSKGLGLAVALLWIVHPLHTESVTYLIQRAESLMGLWYLLMLYALIRAAATTSRSHWLILSVLACWLGMATKPVMVTAPLLALLLDRTFLAGSFRQAWRVRKGYYLFLFASWGLLALILSQPHESVETVGFEGDIPTAWEYARTQPAVILHYLRLALWPYPLVLDYTWQPAERLSQIVWPSVGLGVLLIFVFRLWRRTPAVGFWAWWTVLILAPSSSIIPIVDLAFEHRMYLPLAGIIVLLVLGAQHVLQRWLAAPRLRVGAACAGMALVTGVFGALTIRRNLDYRSEEIMWKDVAAKRPKNPRALNNVGAFLARRGAFEEATEYYQRAMKLQPDLAPTYSNLGMALLELGKFDEAMERYRQALRVDPTYAKAYANIGRVQVIRKEWNEAMANFRKAIELEPENAEFYTSYGAGLFERGELDAAKAQLAEALRLQPDYPDAHYHVGNILVQEGRFAEAQARFERALRGKPNHPNAHNNLANVLVKQGRLPEAASHYVAALKLGHPDPAVYYNLGMTFLQGGRLEDAAAQFRNCLKAKPDAADAHYQLANVLSYQEEWEEAVAQYREVLRLQPDHGEAHNNLGMTLAQHDQFEEALTHLLRARELMPEAAAVHNNIGNTYLRLGNLEEAERSYAKALEVEPTFDEAHNNLGLVLLQRQRVPEAIAHFTEALRLNPDSREAHANLESAKAQQTATPSP